MAGDPTKVYRAFRACKEHLVEAPEGGYRLSSAWFRCNRGGVSVDDGAVSSPEETWERNKPCGVAAVAKEAIAGRQLKLERDPEDTIDDLKANPAHLVVMAVSAKDAKRLTSAAEIIVKLEGWQVRGANGTMGQLPPPEGQPAARAPAATPKIPEDSETLLLFPIPTPKK